MEQVRQSSSCSDLKIMSICSSRAALVIIYRLKQEMLEGEQS
jgi:hypothetical protein